MSGTSLDGIDAALVELAPRGDGYALALRRFATAPFERSLRMRLVEALPPRAGNGALTAELHADLGVAFAQAALRVTQGEQVDYVATHGLTLYHDGPRATTLQIGRPYDLREALRATVVWDFRSADCALGGAGAPLVPYFDAIVFGSAREDRVAVNIGGICNVTVLRRGAGPDDALAFDVGPGVMLLDAFVAQRTGEAFDRDGAYARAGTVDERLLAKLLEDPYLTQPAPKSTGRERFGSQLLQAHREAFARLSTEDGCATLVAFTVGPLVAAVTEYAPEGRVIVSGGGARNRALLDFLRVMLPRAGVEVSDGFGIDADAKEAMAFAILGYETLRGRPAALPRVTGARAAAVLGSIVPHDLCALLAKVEREVQDGG